jgi:hypothetical protein
MSSRSHAATLRLLLAASLAFAAPALAADVTVTLDAGAGFVVEDNTEAIERLRVEEATGNISRNGALFVHTTGLAGNTFVGEDAGAVNVWDNNSAFGYRSLRNNVGGFWNSAFGSESLEMNTTGAQNAAFGSRALGVNTTGSSNSAFGFDALRSATGSRNAAFGVAALANSSGSDNAAFGNLTLNHNTTGYRNVALGERALYSNTTGLTNVAAGAGAMHANTDGGQNVAVGRRALESNTTGDRNIAIGVLAGRYATTGNDNVYIANAGVAGESGQIKIGNSGIHTDVTIVPIFGNTSTGGTSVLVNAAGKLGTTTSSARFKQDVEDLGTASELLAKLRPVRFHYREEAVGKEGAQQLQYGLIAEEVAEVAPELVIPDAQGEPYSVRYHVLPSLLLNEMQKQQRTMESQAAEIEFLRAQQQEILAALSARIEHLEDGPQLPRVEGIQ